MKLGLQMTGLGSHSVAFDGLIPVGFEMPFDSLFIALSEKKAGFRMLSFGRRHEPCQNFSR